MSLNDSRLNVVLVNPLGAALDHYTTSLEHILLECGALVSPITLMEPSSPGQGRMRWVYEYMRSLWKVRRSDSTSSVCSIVIQVWPVVGYWDFVLLRLFLGRIQSLVILHDPHPLVRAVGYGHIARWIASRSIIKASAVVHSDAAAHAVRDGTTIRRVDVLDHPMLTPEHADRFEHNEVCVRVLGQYKADRDIKGMEKLSAQGPTDWNYEAIGRGWPAIKGWNVVNRFITEQEFDHYLRVSTVIVIPYLRFFQSGVAIRSLEVGTPVVGPCISSLTNLLGEESSWLITGDTWLPAVEAAINSDPEYVYGVSLNAYHRALQQWRVWIDTMIET
jgi:hypothetical protein